MRTVLGLIAAILIVQANAGPVSTGGSQYKVTPLSAITSTTPKELLVNNKPIPPICFLHFTGETNQIRQLHLKSDSCINHRQKYNEYMLNKGFLGYELETGAPSMRQPSVYYKYVGKHPAVSNKYFFEIIWSAGGTGMYGQLVLLTKENDTVSLDKFIKGGDRCFGSVHSSSIDGDNLKYQTKATPLALITNNYKLKSPPNYEAIQDCAICCIGDFYYRDKAIVGFRFNGNTPDIDSNNHSQVCFNRIIKQFGAKEKSFIDAKQLTKLQDQVAQQCFLGE